MQFFAFLPLVLQLCFFMRYCFGYDFVGVLGVLLKKVQIKNFWMSLYLKEDVISIYEDVLQMERKLSIFRYFSVSARTHTHLISMKTYKFLLFEKTKTDGLRLEQFLQRQGPVGTSYTCTKLHRYVLPVAFILISSYAVTKS